MYVNKDLKWNSHVRHITNKAISRLYLLFKSIRSHDSKFLIRMYSVYVLPILDYCSSVYNTNSSQNLAVIERVQRLFTRRLFHRCFKYTHPVIPTYTERLRLLSLQSLEERYIKIDLTLFHKLVTNEIAINTTYPIRDFNSTRTNPLGIRFPRSKLDIRRNFFLDRVPLLYTKLPVNIISLSPSGFSGYIKGVRLSDLLPDTYMC